MYKTHLSKLSSTQDMFMSCPQIQDPTHLSTVKLIAKSMLCYGKTVSHHKRVISVPTQALLTGVNERHGLFF